MAPLAAFALFTLLLLKADGRGTAIVVLTLFAVWVILGAIEFSFHASVTVWAAGTGAAPEFYQPPRRWLNYDLQLIREKDHEWPNYIQTYRRHLGRRLCASGAVKLCPGRVGGWVQL